MKTIGIIAEYNPLHDGHRYQLDAARSRYGADAIVVVMSGDFVQRGEPAVMSKYTRAREALSAGADLVLMMPVLSSCAGAETFAAAGVSLLCHTGVVDTLLFGAGSEDAAEFDRVADILRTEPFIFKSTLASRLKDGSSFAAAREAAINACLDTDTTLDLSEGNTTLGLHYISALKKHSSPMDVKILLRDECYKNASAIRSALRDEDLKMRSSGVVSRDADIFPDDLSLPLHIALLDKDDYSGYADCDSDLSNRIKNNLDRYTSVTDFISTIKPKQHTYTHISRVLMHILLGITREYEEISRGLDDAPYIRVLAAGKRGEELLSRISKNSDIPLIANVKNAEDLLTPDAYRLFMTDIHAADVWRAALTSKTGLTYPTEYTTAFTIS